MAMFAEITLKRLNGNEYQDWASINGKPIRFRNAADAKKYMELTGHTPTGRYHTEARLIHFEDGSYGFIAEDGELVSGRFNSQRDAMQCIAGSFIFPVGSFENKGEVFNMAELDKCEPREFSIVVTEIRTSRVVKVVTATSLAEAKQKGVDLTEAEEFSESDDFDTEVYSYEGER